MLDLRGGVNSWNGAKNVVYLHADGAKCVGRPRPDTATDSCAGGCGKQGPGDPIFDMMGIGNSSHMFCEKCMYGQRAIILGSAQEFMEEERIRRETRVVETPRKKRRRVEDGDDE